MEQNLIAKYSFSYDDPVQGKVSKTVGLTEQQALLLIHHKVVEICRTFPPDMQDEAIGIFATVLR